MPNNFTYESLRKELDEITFEKLISLINNQAFNPAYHGMVWKSYKQDKIQFQKYEEYKRDLMALFYSMALTVVGLRYHPKAGKIYEYAYQKGHAYGLVEILMELQDLSRLFRD